MSRQAALCYRSAAMRKVARAAGLAAAISVMGCSSSGTSDQPTKSVPTATVEVSPSPQTAETIKARIEAGASCADLFARRNEIDPESRDIPTINASLREIGCYTSSSTRTK